MASGDHQLSLVPYASDSQEIVLRHGNSVVVWDPHSQELLLRAPADSTIELTDCPFCHRPLHDNPSPFAEEGHSPPTGDEHGFVNPEYFRMLANSIPSSPNPSRSHSPRKRLPASGLDSSRNAYVTTPPAGAEFVGSTPQLRPNDHGIRNSSFLPDYFKRFFIEKRELGRGGRGVVLLVEHVLDGVSLGEFACKRIPVGNDHVWLEKVLVEVQLLQRLNHQNLVSYRHVWLEDTQPTNFGPLVPCIFILQQYCNAGDLHDYLLSSVQTATKREELKERMRRKSRGQGETPTNLSQLGLVSNMRFSSSFSSAVLGASALFASASASVLAKRVDVAAPSLEERALEYVVKPKVFIISMFDPEAEVWFGIPEFDILAKNITVPGFSPLFPDAHCTANGDICQLTTGESEINAAVTIASLVRSPRFDLTNTYFMVAGIAGVNPEVATICSVTFARYAVQVALQYEFDPREIPANFSTGYIPQGSTVPDEYPQSIYGTEVFEVNQNLQKIAANFARNATLNDSDAAIAYRANYAASAAFAAGAAGPAVYECDVATSDVYYSGDILSSAFGNYTTLVTNGSGVYCTTAQEDNATLEALLRAAVEKLVDFSRIIVMRTASDFDRPWPGEAATYNLFYADQGAFEPAIQNIYLAGVKVVEGILSGWNSTFSKGVNASNYIGDIFGTLGGEPDFGPGSEFGDNPVLKKRDGSMGGMKRSSKGRRNMPVKIYV
ncbi:hypothetical protein MBLNU459_g8539t3 [Dothideomycetes sp. NU459]